MRGPQSVARSGTTSGFSCAAANDATQLLTESFTGGTLNGLSVNRTFDKALPVNDVNVAGVGPAPLGAGCRHYALPVANGAVAYPTITVASQYGAGQSQSGREFVPATPEAFVYDEDGNLKQDGRWAYVWDLPREITAVASLWALDHALSRGRKRTGWSR